MEIGNKIYGIFKPHTRKVHIILKLFDSKALCGIVRSKPSWRVIDIEYVAEFLKEYPERYLCEQCNKILIDKKTDD